MKMNTSILYCHGSMTLRASAVGSRHMPSATGLDGATADPGRARTGGPPSRAPVKGSR